MRRPRIPTLAKVAVFVATLPLVLAWAGWLFGMHSALVRERCPTRPPGVIIVGGPCFVRPFWTRPDVLEVAGAIAGILVITIFLVRFRPFNGRRPA